MKELLTQEEHEIIVALGTITRKMCKIHNLQARVMSHTAARAYPNLYRKL
jgi:hypothetical protein